MLSEIIKELGWQGGTIHQVKKEISRLKRIENHIKEGEKLKYFKVKNNPRKSAYYMALGFLMEPVI